MTAEQLQVIISAKVDQFNRSIKGVKQQIGGVENTVSQFSQKITGIFSKIGKMAVAAFGTKALVSFGKEAVSLASDLQEVQNVVDTAFGGMSSQVEAWSKTTIEKFGMSELAAKQTASTYMAMSKGLGLAGQQAANMAMQAAERTGDIASFYNMSQSEADTLIKSIWTGETESLKRIGVVMTQTNLDAYALANGFGKTTDAMTQAEQVQLRYKYVMEQTNLAAGDFQKTSGSWANQTRILSERWKQFMATVGNGLLQVLTPVIQFLNTALQKLVDFSTAVSSVLSKVFGSQSKDQQQSAVATEQAAAAQGELAQNITQTGKAAKGAQSSIDELNILSQDSAESNASAMPAASAGASGLSMAVQVVEPDTSKVEKAAERIKKAFEKIKAPISKAFGSIGNSVSGLWKNTLKPMGEYVVGDFIPTVFGGFADTLFPIFEDTFPVVMDQFAQDFDFACSRFGQISDDILMPSFEHIKTVASDIFGGVKASWDEHGAGILSGFEGFKESVREIWDTLYSNVIEPVFTRISGTVTWLWNDHLKPLWDNLTDFFGSVSEFCLALWNNVLAPVVNYIVQKVGPPITLIVGTIGDVVGTVIAMISDIIGGIIKTLSGLLDFLTGIFTGNWDKAWNGIKKAFNGVWETMEGVAKGTINILIDGINMLWGGVYNVVKGIVDGIGGIAGAIGDIFGQDWHFSMPAEPPLIPKLASGGIVSAPTLAMIGEYSGARSNPEVVAPLNTLVDMIGGARDPEVLNLLKGITMLLEAIKDKDLRLYIGDREIAQAANRGGKALGYSVVTG